MNILYLRTRLFSSVKIYKTMRSCFSKWFVRFLTMKIISEKVKCSYNFNIFCTALALQCANSECNLWQKLVVHTSAFTKTFYFIPNEFDEFNFNFYNLLSLSISNNYYRWIIIHNSIVICMQSRRSNARLAANYKCEPIVSGYSNKNKMADGEIS